MLVTKSVGDDYKKLETKSVLAPAGSGAWIPGDDNSDDDNFALITKIREDLGDSSTNILPFIESCKRNGDSIRNNIQE